MIRILGFFFISFSFSVFGSNLSDEKPTCVAGNAKNQDLLKAFYKAADDAPLKMFWEWRNKTITKAWQKETEDLLPIDSAPCKWCFTNLRDIAKNLLHKLIGGGTSSQLLTPDEPEGLDPRISQSIKYDCVEAVVKRTNFGSPKPQYVCDSEEQSRLRPVAPLPRPFVSTSAKKKSGAKKSNGKIVKTVPRSAIASGPSVGPCVTEEVLLYMTWLINEAGECLAEPNLRLDPVKILEMINNESKFSFLTSYRGGSGLTQVVAGRGAYTEMHRLKYQGAKHLHKKVMKNKNSCKPFQEVLGMEGVKFPCSVLHPGSGLARAVIYGVGYYDYMLNFADRKLQEYGLSPRQTNNKDELQHRLGLATDLATAAYSNAGPGNAMPKFEETLSSLNCLQNQKRSSCATPNIRATFRETMDQFYRGTKLPGGAPRPSYFNNIRNSSRLLPSGYQQECVADHETLQEEQVNKVRKLFNATLKGE